MEWDDHSKRSLIPLYHSLSNSESSQTSVWPGALTWRTSKLSGWKRYSTSPTSLGADHVLHPVWNDEAGEGAGLVSIALNGRALPCDFKCA